MRILFASQTGGAPPTFVLFTNVAANMHFSYLRYLTNRLREEYGFAGTPIRSNILVNLGHGDPTSIFPRSPRLSFDEACQIA